MPEHVRLYPPITPFDSGTLQVSTLHQIYYEISGNPLGIPVIVCHGGPGGGSTPSMRRFFDPQRYKIILFDQRGCGKSQPHASLEDNTTWDLVADMEKLRALVKAEKWLLFGGSWGSTLCLAYAQQHPERVMGLILRGIFTLRRKELAWFYQEGANWVFPEAFEKFIAPIPVEERGDLIGAYHRRLTGTNREEQLRCAKAWSVWEGATVSLYPSPAREAAFASDHFALAFARIECHYFINGGFFKRDDQLLANMEQIADIPGTIVQGRYDLVTPMTTAYALHKAWPKSTLMVVNDAGHAASEPGIVDALVRSTDNFANNAAA